MESNKKVVLEYDSLSIIYDDLYSGINNDNNVVGFTSFLKSFSGGNNILEIGVGTGNIINLLSNAGYKKFVGVDYSSKMLEVAKHKNIPGLTLIKNNFQNITYSGFDWVLAIGNMLNRSDNTDKKELFSKMHSEMDEDALFFIALPNYRYNHDFKRNPISMGYDKTNERFLIEYKHFWIAHNCYHGVAHYIDLHQKYEDFFYSFRTYTISENDLIELITNIGFTHIDTKKKATDGFYENIWVFRKNNDLEDE